MPRFRGGPGATGAASGAGGRVRKVTSGPRARCGGGRGVRRRPPVRRLPGRAPVPVAPRRQDRSRARSRAATAPGRSLPAPGPLPRGGSLGLVNRPAPACSRRGRPLPVPESARAQPAPGAEALRPNEPSRTGPLPAREPAGNRG
ncbi:hypothetical protein SCATT_37540 [Streptantibioticus cattleyicolor NRRL 8057 = DSM 46488]|uniref:Uncharacterized protein n=1 Tax=Streptantibioticus cattleyicolor (strain ATCC 35852 / DSM 46488 / JCM 4925 / NBRC 14057 / NRRL 8057) TaxID=1003195 RepID=G8X2Z3_STREN|nr:hypothetical protein SCATT_37540 [Streptantibioticus cattleyicolor NRRL 8057 = DSM 46488]